MNNHSAQFQATNQEKARADNTKKVSAEATFEEGFRLIAQPLDLTDLEVQMHLHNPIVVELVQKILSTQKLRSEMNHFFDQKFKDIQT